MGRSTHFGFLVLNWCNGIKGDYGTNQRAVEIQLMRKFTSNQFVKDVPLPVEFQKHFKPVMDRLNSRPAGSLQEHSSPEGSIGKSLILDLWSLEQKTFKFC